MTKLENLIKQYKQKQNKKILSNIILLLQKVIKNKAKYIYYKKYYPLSLYHKCVSCRKCIDKKNCANCEKCTCITGTFNLKSNNLCDYFDIENDLWIEILRIIDNYDIRRSFNTYLYATLWNWIPSFITKNFIKELLNKSLTYKNMTEKAIIVKPNQIEKEDLFHIKEKAEKYLTKKEKEVFYILLKDNRLKEIDIAKKLGITQQAISLRIKKIRSKLKNKLV